MTDSSKRTLIFDTVRNMLGRGFKQSEVEALDDALDRLLGDTHEAPINFLQDGSSDRQRLSPTSIGNAGIALIKKFEGCARLRTDGMVEAYPDPGTGGEPWTIGWGATGAGLGGNGRIGPGTVWTRAECDARLESDLVRYADDVVRALDGRATTQNQFDALVSFHYNTGAIARATLTKRHKEGDHRAALREFARWNRAGGRVMKGLTRRRNAEAALYGKVARP